MSTLELSTDLKKAYDWAYAAAYAAAMDQVAFDEDQDAALDWAYDYAINQAEQAVNTERSRLAIEELEWEDDPGYDIAWGDQKDAHGLLHGSCFYYGGHASGNWPYPIVQREDDGKVAFPPTDEGNPFSASEWLRRLNGNA